MILVFLGPPGSGKGTQAKNLAEKHSLPHISLGDILREEVRKGSEIGKRAKELMNAGRLVPDELTIELTRQRVAQPDCKNGFILDGFPRSDIQAEALDKIFEEQKLNLDKVVYFDVSEDLVVERLSGRRSCKACGAVYHVKFKLPKTEGKCDACGGDLYQRKDDEESSVRTRFEVYQKQTKPLIDLYQSKQKLVSIDAGQGIRQVFTSLENVLGHAK
ncbi:MAG: adenylate kinase [Candidatus Margulisiibacteriota bacterium]|nr:adenylate kinase [Candidatus Margulisiibacteriota bacterium]